MQKRTKSGLLFMSLVLIASAVSSCRTSQYKTYTLKHNSVHFSFEYLSGYKTINAYLQRSPGAPVAVRFARARGMFGLLSTDPHFVVNIDSPWSEVKVDPKTAANTASSHTPEQELERTSITIAGMTGELVVYSFPDLKNASTITREVFFDVDGVLWNIYIYSGTDKSDEAKLDFEHIISTFKVLP
jgi:hypothetical protein